MHNTRKPHLSRRNFIGKTSAAVAATLMAPPLFAGKNEKKARVVLVGTGSRGISCWGRELIKHYADYIEMVGMCDSNPKRMQAAKKMLGIDVKTYHAEKFDAMITDLRPDYVIVATTDNTHVDYIVRAMELGCDAISEKPIATEKDHCQKIHDAEKKTGRKVYVGFNVRFMNESIEMKRIISSGEIGRIHSIEYHEYLDTQHGASYFRRWHGKIKYSGSLLVHKASHHFDLINWLLQSDPVTVQAMGKMAFYGSNNSFRGKNCRQCAYTDQCSFFWDIHKDTTAMKLYAECEDVDQYYRDGCVWDPEIDSHDTCSVQVEYANGTLLTYSLNAFLPYEGQYICFSGEKGRLDVRINSRQPWDVAAPVEFRLTRDRKTTKTWTVQPGEGGHGGADERVKDMLFKPGQKDPDGQKAGSRAGILSSMVGIAARESIRTGSAVKIDELIDLS